MTLVNVKYKHHFSFTVSLLGDISSPVPIVPHWSSALAVLYWQFCTGSPVLVDLSCMPSSACHGSSVLHDIISLSLSACPILVVLFWLYFFGCVVLVVLSRWSGPGWSGPAVRSWLSCTGCRALTVLSSQFCLTVLCWQSKSFCPVLLALFQLSRLGCPVLAVLYWLFFMSVLPGWFILPVLCWQTCSRVPVLAAIGGRPTR